MRRARLLVAAAQIAGDCAAEPQRADDYEAQLSTLEQECAGEVTARGLGDVCEPDQQVGKIRTIGGEQLTPVSGAWPDKYPVDALLQRLILPVPKSELTRTVGNVAGHRVSLGELAKKQVSPAQLREPDEDTIATELIESLDEHSAPSARMAVVGGGTYSPAQMANEVRSRSAIGRQIIEKRRQFLSLVREAVRTGRYRIVDENESDDLDDDTAYADPF